MADGLSISVVTLDFLFLMSLLSHSPEIVHQSVSAEDPTIDSMAAMYARMWLGCLLYAAVTKGHQCFAPIAPGVTFSFTRRDSIMTVLSFPSFPTSHMVQSNMNMFG